MKKKIIITISILLVVAIIGVLGVRFATNYFFDRYFLKTVLSSFAENVETGEEDFDEQEPQKDEKDSVKNNPLKEDGEVSDETNPSEEDGEDVETPADEKDPEDDPKEDKDVNKKPGKVEAPKDKNPPKKQLSNTEVINRVMKSSELTNKMASIVPYEDKRTVLKIILSNFSEDELTEIAKKASKGLSSSYKSQLIATARSRLTYSQWKQCLNIAYKYVDQMRPYVE